MKRIYLLILSILLLGVCGCPPPKPKSPVEIEERKDRYALLIGIGDYTDSRFPALSYTVNDAEQMHKTFNKRLGIPTTQMLLLTEHKAKKKNIKKAMDILNTKSTLKDEVYIFYAGHGGFIKDIKPYDEGDGYDECILPIDAVKGNVNSYIIDDEWSSWLGSVKCKKMVIIFDSCHSGGMERTATFEAEDASRFEIFNNLGDETSRFVNLLEDDIDTTISDTITYDTTIDTTNIDPDSPDSWVTPVIADSSGTERGDTNTGDYDGVEDVYETTSHKQLIIAACEPSETSREFSKLKHGVFTWALLKGLNGGADANGDGRIYDRELYKFIRKVVTRYTTKQSPVMIPKSPSEKIYIVDP